MNDEQVLTIVKKVTEPLEKRIEALEDREERMDIEVKKNAERHRVTMAQR